MNDTQDFNQQIATAEKEVEHAQARLLALRRQAQQVDVTDYVFNSLDGEIVPIADLFGDKSELVLIHNMGSGCSYCTLWADSFESATPYFEDRAAFVLMSADPQAKAKDFVASRGWRFRCVSWDSKAFSSDPGIANAEHGVNPGVSTFRRDDDDGRIWHTAFAGFGPGDLYCPVWHIFDLLPNGVNGWEPKYNR